MLELLAVIATIAILAALLLPIVGKAKNRAHQATCLSNLRQLGNAWAMYHEENGGWLVESYPVANPRVWVQGEMTRATDATNTQLIAQSKLYPLAPSLAIYRCPTDEGVTILNEKVRTVRSYSMNGFLGARDPNVGPIPSTAVNYKQFFAKESEITKPSEMLVLLDEDERSINDGFFITDPTGRVWYDFPSISQHRHRMSFCATYADGRGEISKLKDPRTRQVGRNVTEQAGNTDLRSLASTVTTR